MMREYTENYYLRLADTYRQRSSDSNIALELEAWHHRLKQHWQWIHFGNVSSKQQAQHHHFEVQVYLDELPAPEVSVELYADPLAADQPPQRQPLSRGAQLAGSANAYLYTGSVAADRPASDYTPRIIAAHPQAVVPLEAELILWHR